MPYIWRECRCWYELITSNHVIYVTFGFRVAWCVSLCSQQNHLISIHLLIVVWRLAHTSFAYLNIFKSTNHFSFLLFFHCISFLAHRIHCLSRFYLSVSVSFCLFIEQITSRRSSSCKHHSFVRSLPFTGQVELLFLLCFYSLSLLSKWLVVFISCPALDSARLQLRSARLSSSGLMHL